jgi:outer membrane protein assembly factor BamA
MAMFNPVKSDTISPSSMAGLFGMYTTNDTWFLNAFAKLFLKEDNWRITAAGGTGNYNFQFYMDAPISGWIPYQTEIDVVFAQLQRRLYKRFYGGVSYVYLNFTTTLELVPDPIRETLHGLGFDLALDHRSSVYYPRTGFETTLQYFTYPTAFGNEADADKIEFEYNRFVPIRDEQDVIAGRFFAGMGLGALSFNQQFVVGQRQDIRGYTQGEFRGNYMLALQGEYRWNFRPRLGAVGFAAVATIFDAINEDDDGKLLPGVGAGFRFTADTETNMNVGMDIAAGLDDWGIYFRLGEAF